MWYGPNDRNFPGLDRIFPEGKIRRIRGKIPVRSLPFAPFTMGLSIMVVPNLAGLDHIPAKLDDQDT